MVHQAKLGRTSRTKGICLCLTLAAAMCAGRALATPEAEGVPSRALMDFMADLEKLDHPRDFCVMRHGKWVAQGSWRGVLRDEGQQDAQANVASGRTPIGGLTRFVTLAATGIAVEKGLVADDAKLAKLISRMMAEGADALVAGDELSAYLEKSVGESTAAFIVANFMNRLHGPLVHNWTAQPQPNDKRLMRGATGVALEILSLARIGDCFLHNGKSGPRRLVPETWLKRYPVRTAVYGGNVLVVSPEKDAVVAVLSSEAAPQGVLAAVEKLLATFSDKPLAEDARSLSEMNRKRSSLKLPPEKVEKCTKAPSLPSFGERHELLRLAPKGIFRRHSEGDIIKLKDGRLMLMWSRMMGSNSDDAKSHICRRYSSDDGKTWTDDEEVFPTPDGAKNVMCVSLLRLRNGKILLAFLVKTSDKDCRPVCYHSLDEGRTWRKLGFVVSDAYCAYYVFNNARVVQLRSGRLLYAGSSHGGRFGPCITNWLSDDEGVSWRPARNHITAKKPNGSSLRMEEPGSVQLSDGRVMTYFRTDADWQYAAYSSDDGETWGPAAPTSLRSPRSPATLERLGDGRIAAVWNDHESYPQYRFGYPYHNGQRAPMTLGFSSDDGRTWTDRVDLETEGWNCYPFLREYDGKLFIGYCIGGGMRTMRVMSVTLSELK